MTNPIEQKLELRGHSNPSKGASNIEMQKEVLPEGSTKVFTTFADSLAAIVKEAAQGEGQGAEFLDRDEWESHMALVNQNKGQFMSSISRAKSAFQQGITARRDMQQVLRWIRENLEDLDRRGNLDDIFFDLRSLNRSSTDIQQLYDFVF